MGNIKCEICLAVIGTNSLPQDVTIGICSSHTKAEVDAYLDQRDGIAADKARFIVLYNLGQDALVTWDSMTQTQKNAVMKGMLEFNLLSVKLIQHILTGRIR
jgi:hypothetical protein